VIHGDGSNTGLPDTSFASVVCFTMLHHVPTDRLQDQLFAEAFRVLRPGGVFAGSDRLPSLPFRLVHIGDTYNPIRPDELETRLGLAGFTDIRTDVARQQTLLGGTPVSLTPNLIREYPGEPMRRECGRSRGGTPR
jgi:SAM-dependent methyltransferase